MPVYNGEAYLREALDSILHQSYSSFEFIIINDGSTDGTQDILEDYHDPRIRLYHQENQGLSSSLNRGIALAQGEYIARMDADDISQPDRLDKQVAFLDCHPEIGLVGSSIQTMDFQGVLQKKIHYPLDHHLIKWSMCFINPLAHPTVMMRRSAVNATTGYNPDTEPAEDYDLWTRLSNTTRLANLSDPLVYLRRHDSCITHARREMQLIQSIQIARKMMEDILSVSLNEQVVRSIWCREVPHKELHGSAELLYKLCRAYLSAHNLSHEEAQSLRTDAVHRIANLSRHGGHLPIKSLVPMFRLDALLTLRMLLDQSFSKS